MSDPKRRGGGAPSRMPSRGASPVKSANSAAAIVVAIVAVLLAAVILMKWKSNDDDAVAPVVGATDQTVAGTNSTTPASGPQTIQPPAASIPAKKSFLVVVANSSGKGGAAGDLTTALTGRGFKLGKATNASTSAADAKSLKQTTIYYTPGQAAAAKLVGDEMGLLTAAVEVQPGSLKIESEQSAQVIVLLGLDLAKKALPPSVTG